MLTRLTQHPLGALPLVQGCRQTHEKTPGNNSTFIKSKHNKGKLFIFFLKIILNLIDQYFFLVNSNLKISEKTRFAQNIFYEFQFSKDNLFKNKNKSKPAHRQELVPFTSTSKCQQWGDYSIKGHGVHCLNLP